MASDYIYVYGETYIPLEVDSDGESITPADIEQMAHDFLAKGWTKNVDIMHNNIPCGAEIVESFIAKEGDPEFTPGAWVVKVRIPRNSEIAKAIIKGELNGFSLQMRAFKVPVKVAVSIAKIVVGTTEVNTDEETPAHRHDYYIELDDNGNVLFGITDEVLGHKHTISGTVVTDVSENHNHRFFVEI